MDKAFHGIRIGANVQSIQKLGLKPIDRSGAGAAKITKWVLKTGNEMSVTYDSERDKILYMEVDWNQRGSSTKVGITRMTFGKTTLEDIRQLYGSNGFSYAKHMMFQVSEGIITFNAFELAQAPSIIVVFITKLSDESRKEIAALPEEQRAVAAIPQHFKLDAVAVADESYLDELWGKEKLYDPKSLPIKLSVN